MTSTRARPRCPHRQIAAQLRDRRSAAATGPPGERLPSIPAIAEMFGVAKQTVQRTHRPAPRRGRADHQAGLGHVRARHPAPAQPAVPRPLRRPPRLPRRPRRPVPAAPRPRSAGRRRRRRSPTRSASPTAPSWWSAGTWCAPTDAPVEVGASWFRVERRRRHHAWSASEAFGRPLYQEAEEATGRRYATRDRHDQRPPAQPGGGGDPRRSAPDTPVLHLLHVAYDAAHRPIEVAQATWPGPMTTLTEEYTIPVAAARRLPAPTSPDLALG